MVRGKKGASVWWTAGFDTDNLLQVVLDGNVLFWDPKLMDISEDEFKSLIDVYNYYPEFHEAYSSAVFLTHWNNEKYLCGTRASGKIFQYAFVKIRVCCPYKIYELWYLLHDKNSNNFLSNTHLQESKSRNWTEVQRMFTLQFFNLALYFVLMTPRQKLLCKVE